MSRDVKVNNASSIVCEDDKDEQDLKPNGVDGEEVDGSELRNIDFEETSSPTSAMAVLEFGPCTWQRRPQKS